MTDKETTLKIGLIEPFHKNDWTVTNYVDDGFIHIDIEKMEVTETNLTLSEEEKSEVIQRVYNHLFVDKPEPENQDNYGIYGKHY